MLKKPADIKNIAILGSTGSIGVKALDVIRSSPDKYRIVALSAGRNIELLSRQIRDFRPMAVAVLEETTAARLRSRFPHNTGPEIFFGNDGFIRLATLDETDTIISAMTGAAGLLPTYEAIKAGKNIALANKETMVMAGPLVMAEAEKQKVLVLPVDSEHSAIFQAIHGHPREDVKRVVLTASGGPFRDFALEKLNKVTPAQALTHPNWKMGPKISIDSATMMNKGLEAIEAKWLFNLDMDQISILVHPESIVHSMVEYKDGAILAQLGIPDMFIPISYALSYPRHVENRLPSLDLERIGKLHFEKPDLQKFRCLNLALKAAETGESAPSVLNGANEIAVQAFLDGRIRFQDIPDLIEKTLAAHKPHHIDNIERVMKADSWARDTARHILQTL